MKKTISLPELPLRIASCCYLDIRPISNSIFPLRSLLDFACFATFKTPLHNLLDSQLWSQLNRYRRRDVTRVWPLSPDLSVAFLLTLVNSYLYSYCPILFGAGASNARGFSKDDRKLASSTRMEEGHNNRSRTFWPSFPSEGGDLLGF